MKRLLMIIPFFPPNAGGGVHRPLSFVKYLERYGWRTTVITPGGGSFWVVDETLVDEIPPSCEVVRTKAPSGQLLLSRIRPLGRRGSRPQVRSSGTFGLLRRIGSFALLPDTYIGWYPFAVRAGRRLVGRVEFDAMYSTSPPETSHLIAHRLHECSGIPWVADFRDPWMNLHLLPTPTPLHRSIHERLERAVCTKASVVVTTRWHETLLVDRYPGMKAVRVIPNGYDHVKFEAHSALEPPREPFVILHAGTLTQKRTAVPFLRGLRIFIDREPEATKHIRVLFVGPRESESEEAARRLGLEGVVEFRDGVPHEESLKLERRAHILLLIKHLNPLYRGIVPGKLYEYLGARRPILALVADGEVKDIVLRLRRGEVVAPGDPEQVAGGFDKMYRGFLDGTLDENYDLSVVTEYRRETLAARLAEHLDSIRTAGTSP